MTKNKFKLSTKEKLAIWAVALGIIILSMGIKLIYSGYNTAKLKNDVSYCQSQNDYLMDVFRASNYKDETLTSSMSYEEVEVCSAESTFKSWMPYTAIKSPSSRQYQQLQQDGIATDHYYGFVTLDGYPLVAMGEMYGPIGTKYLISFSGGTSVEVVIGDIKHEGCTSSRDGSMIEFIVDLEHIPASIKKSGNFNDLFKGTITSIYKIAE